MITWSYVGKLANTLLVFAFLTMLVFAILASAPQTLTFAGIAPAGAPAFIAPDQSFIGTGPMFGATGVGDDAVGERRGRGSGGDNVVRG